MASDNEEFDLFAVEGVPSVPVVTTIATTPLGVAAPRRQPKRTRRLAPLRTVVLLSAGVLLALVLVRAALRFHSEYNLLAEVRREGAEYWRTVCSEGRTRPPNSYDQCTRAKTAAHQFTSLLALERVLHLALRDINPVAECVPGTSCAFVWMKASEAAIRLMDSVASNLTLALGLLSYFAYANVGPLIWAWFASIGRRRQPRAK